MSNPRPTPILPSTAGPPPGHLPPWGRWQEAGLPGAAWASPGLPEAPPPGWPLGGWAKALGPADPWPRLGQGKAEALALRGRLEEALRRAGGCGLSFLILPGAVGDPEAPHATDEVALLLDALGAPAEREGCALWIPLTVGGPGWVVGPEAALALGHQVALPSLRFALAAGATKGQLPWEQAPLPWRALGPALGGWLAQGQPPQAWRWPGPGPSDRAVVWWPHLPGWSLEALAEGCRAWAAAEGPWEEGGSESGPGASFP